MEPKVLDAGKPQSVGYCIPEFLRDLQIQANVARPNVGRIERVDELRQHPIALVNFGPSLGQTWEAIRDFKHVMSCSGAHQFLVDHGIIPTWHVDVDPRAHKVKLLGTPQRETEYLLAATCHPDLFDHLADYNVKLWHIFDATAEGLRMLPFGEWAVTGGCSVGVRLLTLARFLGFTDFHIFGMDGCFAGDDSHAASHPNSPKAHCVTEYDGVTYRTTPAMLEAARNTWHELNQLRDCSATFYGDGLVQAMAMKYERQAVKADPIIGFAKEPLISASYREQNAELHRTNLTYGAGGAKHVPVVLKIMEDLSRRGTLPPSCLDYGAGKGLLAKALPFPIAEYDPAIPGKQESPRPADLTICSDVLEHIEPELLGNVLRDLQRVTRQVGYFVIHTGPAIKQLPDGRNTHLIQKGRAWWEKQLGKYFAVAKVLEKPPELHIVVGPRNSAVQAAATAVGKGAT